MENTEPNTNRIQLAAKIDPAVHAAVEQLAAEDERTISNMVERLLKQSPPVKEILEAKAAASAN